MRSLLACGVAIAVVVSAACSSNGGTSTGTAGQPPGAANATAATSGNESAAPGASSSPAAHATGSPAAATQAPAHQTPPAEAPRAVEPPKPTFKEIVVPSGTTLSLKLQSSVASDSSKAEDKVRATLNKPLVVDGTTAVPAGAEVTGTVLEATEAGRVKGRASIALRFERLEGWKETYDLHTARVAREAEATKGEDAKKIGIGAGAGAAIGAIAGGKKGAGIGALVGGGAGTGVVMATKGEEVRLGAGTVVTTTLTEALKVSVPLP